MERSEICELYVEFLSLCLKTYIFANELIEQEIKKVTDNELEDGWAFFLLVFNFGAEIKQFKNKKTLMLYVQNLDSDKIQLTEKGQALYEYLNRKIELQAGILKFNNVSFYDLVYDINCMSKMTKFFKILLKK